MKRLTTILLAAFVSLATLTCTEVPAHADVGPAADTTVCQTPPYGTVDAPCSTPWADGHVLAPRQTLWRVSLIYYGTGHRWRDIAAFNGITNPRRVRAGTVLLLPIP